MQGLLIVLPLLFFTLWFGQSDCFVTQLPECGRYRGNFSVRHDDKYFEVKDRPPFHSQVIDPRNPRIAGGGS